MTTPHALPLAFALLVLPLAAAAADKAPPAAPRIKINTTVQGKVVVNIRSVR